jgi:hypothetical protein
LKVTLPVNSNPTSKAGLFDFTTWKTRTISPSRSCKETSTITSTKYSRPDAVIGSTRPISLSSFDSLPFAGIWSTMTTDLPDSMQSLRRTPCKTIWSAASSSAEGCASGSPVRSRTALIVSACLAEK